MKWKSTKLCLFLSSKNGKGNKEENETILVLFLPPAQNGVCVYTYTCDMRCDEWWGKELLFETLPRGHLEGTIIDIEKQTKLCSMVRWTEAWRLDFHMLLLVHIVDGVWSPSRCTMAAAGLSCLQQRTGCTVEPQGWMGNVEDFWRGLQPGGG